MILLLTNVGNVLVSLEECNLPTGHCLVGTKAISRRLVLCINDVTILFWLDLVCLRCSIKLSNTIKVEITIDSDNRASVVRHNRHNIACTGPLYTVPGALMEIGNVSCRALAVKKNIQIMTITLTGLLLFASQPGPVLYLAAYTWYPIGHWAVSTVDWSQSSPGVDVTTKPRA
jgi:hypothetical protein